MTIRLAVPLKPERSQALPYTGIVNGRFAESKCRALDRLILGQGMRLALFGVALGVAGALAMTRLMGTLLYGVIATDALTFGAVALRLWTVALAACYAPVRRAVRVDPMVALRPE